ncbi:MAG: hypothetical protein K1X63_05670 [Chitinophagales bacterium]|nr:hypothetical protein [Chitinophagales bacterium]
MKSFVYSFFFLFAATLDLRAQNNEDFETTNITTATITASSFISNNEGWVADDAGILRYTSDGTQSFSQVASGKYFLSLAFINASTGYGITTEGLFKTTNGGVAWSALTLPGADGSTMYFFDANTGLVAGKEAIYKTTNGGTSWTTIATEGVSFVDLYFISSSTGIAAAMDDDYRSIWRTTDGGDSWSNVFAAENCFIKTIWFTSENTGWAAGYYSELGRGKLPIIHRTNDGGLTWVNVYTNEYPGDIRGETFLDIRFKNENEGIAIADFSENVITNDGGVTWKKTYTLKEDLIASYGIYKILAGFSEMYLMGSEGSMTKWE